MRAALLVGATLVAGAAPPPGATNCSGCHAAGASLGSAADLAAAMLAYRSGERPSTIMGRLTRGLTPDQIQGIATWVSAQNG